MTDRFRIALAQLNPLMGDIAGNLRKARAARAEAAKAGADLVLFPELYIVGYPPEDLVLKPALQDDAREAIGKLAAETADGGPAMLIGTPWVEEGKLHNAFALLDGGKIAGMTFKVDLPNYGVFDEKRVFAPGPMPGPFNVRGLRIGVPICEDIWTPDIVECLSETGGEILLVPNGSPFEAGKEDVRLNLIVARVKESSLPLVYLNQVGGQDEVVFDGASLVCNADGTLAHALPAWEEALVVTDWTREAKGWVCAKGDIAQEEDRSQAVYHAMMLGLRDYVNKNRFPGVVLGLSGGIDSALSAAVAVDALGAERVRCVMLPSRYTSQESLDDGAEVARLLGCSYETISIEHAVTAFGGTLASAFAGKPTDTTEENIQSRIRAVILMALSNKFGPMLLTTGNKSEMSVGYATLYGDMCGGYNVLKDVYKTEVFRLARWRNANLPRNALGPKGRVMPDNVITRPPSAELRADQKDEDSLPPYAILDGILECLVEDEMKFEDVVRKGFHPATVKRIEQLLYTSEYKRRQAPPGVKITRRSFGRDRRYPITNAFRDARDV
ncbi:MAG: NAD+ synthase [Alphaproteobacteria bacterium]|nr:NAD+ synthase [Alphaproteobacteria bacterium]MBV9693780.1 NAD+ synthase [Alphaproteobacteria bacterium]